MASSPTSYTEDPEHETAALLALFKKHSTHTEKDNSSRSSCEGVSSVPHSSPSPFEQNERARNTLDSMGSATSPEVGGPSTSSATERAKPHDRLAKEQSMLKRKNTSRHPEQISHGEEAAGKKATLEAPLATGMLTNERARTSVKTSAAHQSKSDSQASSGRFHATTGQEPESSGESSTKIDPSECLDNLRIRFLATGLWYEDVDPLIRECEGTRSEFGTDIEGLVLIPSGEEPLSFPKATKLLTGLDLSDLVPDASQAVAQKPRSRKRTKHVHKADKINPKTKAEVGIEPLRSTTKRKPWISPFSFSDSQRQTLIQTESPETLLLNQIRFGGTRKHHQVRSLRALQGKSKKSFEYWKSWNGTSHDVMLGSWSADGLKYAVGSTALIDLHTSQYNRPNNLLIGHLVTNTLTELPHHWTRRPKPCDPSLDRRLFQPLSAVKWAADGFEGDLITAGYDRKVRIWDTSNVSDIRHLRSIKHDHKITDMALSDPSIGMVLTGTDVADRGLRMLKYDQVKEMWLSSLLCLTEVPLSTNGAFHYSTTSLQFGPSSITNDYFTAGFSRDSTNELPLWPVIEGALQLWRLVPTGIIPLKLQPSSQNVFDIAWHSTKPYIATATVAPLTERRKNRVRSVVRIYQPSQARKLIEYDCPAADINNVMFCPFDDNYITASATDGCTYVWDYRNPAHILHHLRHGEPISELPHDRPREVADVGVRVSVWNDKQSTLYTGGSDGILKEWDIKKSPEDAFLQDITHLQAEVTAGSLSPDGSNMLLGDASGRIHLLSQAPWDSEEITYVPAPYEILTPEESGQEIAANLVETGQIEIVPGFGAGKGVNYTGPFASWATEADRAPRGFRRQEKRKRSDVSPRSHDLAALEREVITIPSDEEKPVILKYKVKRKKKVKLRPHIWKGMKKPSPSRRSATMGIFDLTMEDEEIEDKGGSLSQCQRMSQASEGGVDDTDGNSEEVGVDDPLDEDFWFPPHSTYDANIRMQEA